MRVKMAYAMICAVVAALFVLVPVVLAAPGKKEVPKRSTPEDELKKALEASSEEVPAVDGGAARSVGGNLSSAAAKPSPEKKNGLCRSCRKLATHSELPVKRLILNFFDCLFTILYVWVGIKFYRLIGGCISTWRSLTLLNGSV